MARTSTTANPSGQNIGGRTMRSLAFTVYVMVLAVAIFQILSAPQGATAQTTDAVCQSNFSWASNTRQQNPCAVAAYVQGACVGGQWNVPALTTGRHYVGPTVAGANACECSTVTYDLIAICGLCQGQITIAWSVWSANCSSALTSIGSYPQNIPAGTAIPAWAYLDPTLKDTIDPAEAKALANLPDSSAIPSSTAASSTTATSNPGQTSDTGTPGGPASTGSPAATSGGSNGGGSNASSSPNIGAIVGGVVGGLVGLGLIVILIVFLVKRNSTPTTAYSPAPMSNAYANNAPMGAPPTPFGNAPLLAGTPPPASTYSHGAYSGPGSPPPPSMYGGSQSVYAGGYAASDAPSPRPYNPNDPSTFPTNPSSMQHPGQSFTPVSQRPGQYTGVAEI